MKKSTIIGLALALSTPPLMNSTALAQWTTSGSDVYTSNTAYEVGIGQFTGTANTPQRLLHLWSTGANQLRLQDQNGSWDIGGGGDFHIIQNSTGSDIFNYNTVSNFIRIGPGPELYLNTSTDNVGVGTGSSPSARFEASSASTTEAQIKATSTNNSDYARVRLSGNGNDFTIAVGSPSSGTPNVLNVYTHTGNTNVLSVTSGGRVGVKQTAPSYDLDVTGNIRCTGTLTTSDVRWKTNVHGIVDALDKVLSLRGVTYQFKRDEFPSMSFPAGTQVGFIAQEVETIMPEIVSTDDRGYKSVAYQNVTALLVEATKEQQAVITKQQTAIEQLSARLAELEVLVNRHAAGVDGKGAELLNRVMLDQNEPNPADGSTKISYYLPSGIGGAELVVNEAASGREVHRSALTGTGAGSVLIGADRLSAGSYVYSVVVGGKVATSRMMIVAR